MSGRMELKICHLYPDLLNTCGDGGNIVCIQKRLLWRGIDSSVTNLPVGARTNFCDFDLFFVGGGQSVEQEILLADLAGGKAADIRAAVEDEKVFLAIDGGYQLMGLYYMTQGGVQYDFTGAVDFYTSAGAERITGDFMFDTGGDCGGVAVGFENHGGRTYLGEGVSALGTVLRGGGNNGEDKTEGCRYKNVFGSYAHGPLLPKNPRLADYILKTALERKYPGFVLEELDDAEENAAHGYMAGRLST